MAALAPHRTSDETEPTAVPTPPAPRAPQPLRPSTVKMTMYFSADGRLHHTRCRTQLQFRGVTARIESDFWCLTCHEHVAVPHFAITQIPVESDDAATGTEAPVVRLVVRKEIERRRSAG